MTEPATPTASPHIPPSAPPPLTASSSSTEQKAAPKYDAIDHDRLEKCFMTFFAAYPLVELFENKEIFDNDRRVMLHVNDGKTGGTSLYGLCSNRVSRKFNVNIDWGIDVERQNAIDQLIQFCRDNSKNVTQEFEVRLHCNNIFNCSAKTTPSYNIPKETIKLLHPSIVKLAKELNAVVEFSALSFVAH